MRTRLAPIALIAAVAALMLAISGCTAPAKSVTKDVPKAGSTEATPPMQASVKVLDTGNPMQVTPGAKSPTFKIAKPGYLTALITYHMMEAGGPLPGKLSVKDASGKVFGPWPASGIDGQGGIPNAYWVVQPKWILLPAGTYTVIDSDPGTWSANKGSKGLGFTQVYVGYAK
jgi:hypothetical protein